MIKPSRGFSAGNHSPRMSSIITSNFVKAVIPMSDEKDTDNPYQPPAPSDEPLAKKVTSSPTAKPEPYHWAIPCLGYGYVPLMIGLLFGSQDRFGALLFSTVPLLFLLPVYGLVILGLTVQRIKQKNNSPGLTTFQILSIVPPTVWGLFWMLALSQVNGIV